MGDPTKHPTPQPTQDPAATQAPVPRIETGLPDGRSNFCGTSVSEASENCNFARHCPSGNNQECPEDMYCFVNVDSCNVNDLPTMKPTISPKPTLLPTHVPTTRNPSFTETPTGSPLDADDIRNFFFCGTSWGDASSRCYMRCLSGNHAGE